MTGWRFRGLTLKLLLALVSAMVLISAAQGIYNAIQVKRGLQRGAFRAADRIAEVVRRSSRSSMLRNNREEIQEMLENIAAGSALSGPGIKRVRVFNEEGQIIYSSDKSEVGRRVDNQKDEACLPCHAGGKTLAQISAQDRLRTFREPDGSRSIGVIVPVENEKACFEADCHAHPANQRILGVLDVNNSLKDADAAMSTSLEQTLVGMLIAAAVAAAVAILFVMIMVQRPVKVLMAGTRRVAAGDLDHAIQLRSRDELGLLADAFNDMTRRLKEAMQVVQHWNETLQKRVAEKTEELQLAQDHLLRVERMATLGRLAAIVAHEINNPLAGIRTYAKLLQKRCARPEHSVDDDDIRYLSLMEREAARCGDIVLSLLQFSRKDPMNLEKQPFGQILEESIQLVKHRLDLQNIEVRKEIPPDLPEIACNGQQIVQAIIAILINACEAMPQEGTLTIAAGVEEGGVWTRVKDTGVGMDKKTMEQIFEPFFSTKEETSGVGLGLAVVYGIVQRHGGRIEVASQIKQGSTFTLHFPLMPPQAPEVRSKEGDVAQIVTRDEA